MNSDVLFAYGALRISLILFQPPPFVRFCKKIKNKKPPASIRWRFAEHVSFPPSNPKVTIHEVKNLPITLLFCLMCSNQARALFLCTCMHELRPRRRGNLLGSAFPRHDFITCQESNLSFWYSIRGTIAYLQWQPLFVGLLPGPRPFTSGRFDQLSGGLRLHGIFLCPIIMCASTNYVLIVILALGENDAGN